MKSFYAELIKTIQSNIDQGFALASYDRQLLVYIILSLLMDKGIYDYEVPNEDINSMENHGIVYSFDDATETLKVRVVFPEEAKQYYEETEE